MSTLGREGGADAGGEFDQLYRDFTWPKQFPVTLRCPGCDAVLADYSCPACASKGSSDDLSGILAAAPSVNERPGISGEPNKGTSVSSVGGTLLIAFSYLAAVGLGVIGFIAFGKVGGMVGVVFGVVAGQIVRADALRERLAKQAEQAQRAESVERLRHAERARRLELAEYAKLVPLSPEVLLAQRYQKDVRTYDEAAACYFAWVTKITRETAADYLTWLNKATERPPVENVSCPDGFSSFLSDYRYHQSACTGLRDALFNAVIAQFCYCPLADDWTSALEAAFTGSPEQDHFLRVFFSAASRLRSVGKTLTIDRVLGDSDSRIGRVAKFSRHADNAGYH